KRVLLEKNTTYTMVETTAPDGYEIAESITFMVDANGTLKIKGSDGTFSEKADKTVQMKDAPKTQPKVVKISKVNLGGTEIEGAEIDITGANGQPIPWTSSATPIEIILAPGTYTFKETAAPSGYQVVSTFTFTVDAGGNVSVNNAATTGFASVVNGVLVVKDNAYPGTVDGDSNSPQLGTTVTAGNSTANANTPAGITTAEAQAGVNVTDRIAYKNLIGGKVYSVTTKLYKVENSAITGNAIVTKTGDQTANGVGSGTWAVNLGSVSGLEPGASYVIYESAVSKENLVDTTGDSKPDAPQTVTHENPNDKSQTIVVENSVTPTEEPTPTPSEEPTPTPSEGPTPTPSEGPTPTPSEEPTPTPSEEPTPTPSEDPTPTPSEEPTPTPSEGPTSTPSEGPTPTPSEGPTPTPSEEPTPTPSEEPTPTPSEEPTPTPSEGPTPTPSEGPTPTPSEGPTPTPSEGPTPTPSEEPTPTPAPSTGPDLTGGGDIKTIAKANNSTASTTAPAFVFEQPVVMVSDTLAYTNLKGDKDYRVITELYLLQNGAVVGDPLAWTAQIVPTSGSGNGTWTIDLGGVSGLKAGRSYVIYERVESVDKLIDTTGDGIADAPQVVEHKNPNAISQTIVVDPEPNTSAGGSLITKASVNSHFASSNAPASISEEEADQGVSINDMISYKNLIGGAKYSIISSLFRVENGVVVGNPIVTAMSEKIADNSGQGAWRTGFSNIIGLEAGARYVIYERVESVEELIDTNNDGTPDAPHIVKHEDPTDNAQSITVVGGVAPAAPSMATTVSANNSTANANVPAGITAAEAQAGVDVTDSIAYKNLIGGKVYSVTTKLYKVANGAVVGEAKKVLTTEQTASASGSGTWIINLGKVSGLEPGASYVIYESAVSKENLVDTTGDGMPDAPQTVKHENPNDKSQTIVVLRPGAENPGSKKSYPQTGDNAPLAYSMLGLLLAAVGFIIFGKKRRHNN
ncbi:MAG: VaFE repeat-containing surface-anchored protein, partial [Eubacteriales bacterium]|nr:VaFE repeat-containing surface-anchored protein [Eubacteriales bacterium]